MPSSILVIEDEPAISELISVNLQHAGHCPIRAYNAEQAQNLISDVLPDLILLDWMLPGKSGVNFARDLRNNERTKHIPIIMLTARGDEQDKVLGLEIGADDYVTKPFSPREVVARVRAVLRRAGREGAAPVNRRFGRLEIDEAAREARVDGRLVRMKPREFALLLELTSNAGVALSRDRILERLWGFDYSGDARTVDVHVRRLRLLLEEGAGLAPQIETIHGYGYKFVKP
jgi:two-component system, OmpR family, phosphate regulon response regulator PhoB